jgi:hypothetical protein
LEWTCSSFVLASNSITLGSLRESQGDIALV